MGTEEREAVKERENAELGTRNPACPGRSFGEAGNPEHGAAGEALTRWLSINGYGYYGGRGAVG